MNAEARCEFDVIVPAFQEERHIGRCLDSIFAQDFPPDSFRVWVVDAGSTDGTADIVRVSCKSEPRLSLLTGDGRLNPGQALNLAIAAGTSPLIARVDAHTTIEPDYLKRAAELMGELGEQVACVGGQPVQAGETRFGEAVALARRSRFGVGGSIYSDTRERAVVDTVQAGVYRRSALAEIGGFVTTIPCGEDEECNWRLRQAGYDIVLDTSLRFHYTTRSSWPALYRQYRNYGMSRVQVVATHPDFLRPRHLVPSAFVGTLVSLAVLGTRDRRARAGLAVCAATYGTAATAAAIAATRGTERSLTPCVAASFTAQHLGYGVGVISGVLSALAVSVGLARPRLTVSRR